MMILTGSPDKYVFDGPGNLEIGKEVYIEPFTVFYCYSHIKIGDGTHISSGVRIVDFEHDYVDFSRNKIKKGEVIIGKKCLIGTNAVVLKNVTLGDGCIVGAGAIVTKSFPANSIIVGNPARLLRRRTI